MILPFTADQPFWAKRCATLGVSVTPSTAHIATHKQLIDGLERTLSDMAMRARAQALGAQIATEEGVQRAIAILVDQSIA